MKIRRKMNIVFFKAVELESNVKATIHISGRLGFNSNALKKLNLAPTKFIKIGTGENYEQDKVLYLIVCDEADDETFNLAKAGEYFYANTKGLFDSLKIDYENQKVIYDISEFLYKEVMFFKLKPRIRERKKEDID